MTAVPLSESSLAVLPEAVRRPAYDRASAGCGVVHLGVGAFHRSHQAVYFDRLLALGHAGWGITGVGVLGADRPLHAALRAQDGLYTLVLKAPDGSIEPAVVGSLLELLLLDDDPEAVLAAMAAPRTRLVSMTITEGGYSTDKSTGLFRLDDALAADLTSPRPRTAFGLLTEALRRRRAAGTPPFTVVSCDNVESNGDLTRQTLLEFARLQEVRTGDGLADWIAASVAFPNSMVDRITPATTDEDRGRLTAETGLVDRWPVVAEPYLQWVLEDRFSDARPPLEEVGVQLVEDVHPYELMKLRLLNASHQVMSYLGYLAGHRRVDEVMADPLFAELVERYMRVEATPTLPPVPDTDLGEYRRSLLERFANPAVSDTLARNCAEGSERIATFVLPVIREQLAAGGPCDLAVLAVAGWARYAGGIDEDGNPIPVVDARSDRLAPLLRLQDEDPLAVLTSGEVFGDLADDERFRRAYSRAAELLDRYGARGAAMRILSA
ncbi:mannitol dehydrogenase family protein [Blastococcus saxobsidens]|uniref:Mannitol-1-phosphate 5-dehydrogenase n=1 Tax=Blastococcus saxobsidens (strain DD2) TaxID=1146883 RepID=H6RPF1_BLASD|nr:mannitol dehydrogenase family protein [Blastococcus saxobsidens]CCG04010.1 Mannitol 2-dehydrogenase [Blastococcus saxobsidens DD2]